MNKCTKCGSTNIKVDHSVAYTSFPEKYGYCCQDCGDKGFLSLSSNDIINDVFDIVNKENTKPNAPKEENKVGGLMGWICTKCGRCYSPFTTMCPYCNNGINGDWNGFKVTC